MGLIKQVRGMLLNEVRCAMCLYRIPKHSATEVYGRSVCTYCIDYLKKTYPNDWKERVKPMML